MKRWPEWPNPNIFWLIMSNSIVNSIGSHQRDPDIQLEQDDPKVAVMKKNVELFDEEDV